MTWDEFINQQREQAYFQSAERFVAQQRAAGKTVYPPEEQVFSAFEQTPLDKVKVVILGQDPYHGPGQAHGLSFSVLPGNKIPPSLRNIYKELATDIEGFVAPEHGCLESWAQQGVLLLNTVLTVEEGMAHSHAKCGWEPFTQSVIDYLADSKRNLVFILWGAHAQKKGADIKAEHHLVLRSAHPSPLSARRGFLGSKPFSQANRYLEKQGVEPIEWKIPSINMSLF